MYLFGPQLLWVNLIMDTMGALALATEDPNPDLLNDKVGQSGAGVAEVTLVLVHSVVWAWFEGSNLLVASIG